MATTDGGTHLRFNMYRIVLPRVWSSLCGRTYIQWMTICSQRPGIYPHQNIAELWAMVALTHLKFCCCKWRDEHQ